MNLRQPKTEDIQETGKIIYEAFRSIGEKHNFPIDFPTVEAGVGMAELVINDPKIYGVIAEEKGRIIGSNFLWEHDEIAGVGPITIAPDLQSNGVGRKLMEDVIEHGKNAAGIRLVQAAFNSTSMSLYTSLGFEIVEPLVLIEGSPKEFDPENDVRVRAIEEKDFEETAALCRKIHGIDRKNEVKQTAGQFQSFVAVRGDRIVGYITAPDMWQLNHAVAETTDDMKSVLSGAARLSERPLSFLLPTRQAELFRWCLIKGMRVIQPLSLMARGFYQEPKGSFLPSVLY
ncbi:MAG: GNAT family N-acetyltransferase [Pyrinomonadaceae bacterium]|nr:GNAT family N-acetyltransferase [Pyrinomonadaceae bacterium]